jgi:hypothetical protein
MCLLMSICTCAQPLPFSVGAEGVDKSVHRWGLDTSWTSSANMRESIVSFGGPQNVDTVRISFHPRSPFRKTARCTPRPGRALIARLRLQRCPETSRWFLTPASDDGATPHEWYSAPGGGVIPERFAAMLIATANYPQESA